MIVFVTGASAGFGAAIARTFVKGGHRVIATARRKDRLLALSNELGDALLPLELDVRDDAAIAAALASLPEAFSQIDVLVNNAGLALGLEPAQRADLDDWKKMIDTNCTGLVAVTHARAAGHGRAQSRPRVQYRLGRGHLPVRGRQRVWRDARRSCASSA